MDIKLLTDVEKQNYFVMFVPGSFTHEGVTRQNYIKIPVGHTVGMMTAPVIGKLRRKARRG